MAPGFFGGTEEKGMWEAALEGDMQGFESQGSSMCNAEGSL